GLQILILQDNGYTCDEAVAYYAKTKQRVRLTMSETFRAELQTTIANAWETARSTQIPPPLIDSPKCPGCSLVGICLPDETWNLQTTQPPVATLQLDLFEVMPSPAGGNGAPSNMGPRLLQSARDEHRPLYLNTQGLRVGKSGEILRVKEKEAVVQ